MSTELTQYVAYVGAMALTPAIGFVVLGCFWLVRSAGEAIFRRIARFPS
ncbi:hypothetical protein [Bradyrhizobium sp. DASA03007]